MFTHLFNRFTMRFTRAFAAALLGLAAFGMPSVAHAQLGPLYGQLLDQAQQQLMKQLMAKMGLGVEGAVEQSGGATQAEILKGATVNKEVMEGVESYHQQELLRRSAQDTAESLRQPATTCETMAVQGGLGSAEQNSRTQVLAGQRRVMRQLATNTDSMQALESAHRVSNATTCTAAEAARGICRVNGQMRDLAGGDQNAAFLFQGKDGSQTYVGARDGPQSQVADSYISRIVANMPPEQLRGANYARNPQARAYVELMRRYKAVVSMAAYSLNQIKVSHEPQPNLGNDTMMATVNVPGFQSAKADMSMMEAVQRFVATKFSPESIKDSATATNPNLILRDMAQMNAFQLWIDQQTLLQDSRTEALMAHQLALLTEQTLRPQLEAQRNAAARSAGLAR